MHPGVHPGVHTRTRAHNGRAVAACQSPHPVGARLSDTNDKASVKEKSQSHSEGDRELKVTLNLEIFTGDHKTPTSPRDSQVLFLGSVNLLKCYARFCILIQMSKVRDHSLHCIGQLCDIPHPKLRGWMN